MPWAQMPILARTPLEMTSSVSLKKFRSFYAIDVYRASCVILRAGGSLELVDRRS